jgi:hypothetical protein
MDTDQQWHGSRPENIFGVKMLDRPQSADQAIKTGDDFKRWMLEMGRLDGLPDSKPISERRAAELLGWSREAIRRVLRDDAPVPLYISLACRMRVLIASMGLPGVAAVPRPSGHMRWVDLGGGAGFMVIEPATGGND